MYVEPGTFIKVLSGVRLTPSYEHTIWFPDKQTQANWFAAHTRYTFSEYTYQRVQRGYVRVGLNAEQLYDCNYMMFQNSTFGTKWFYAFIDNVEYINNETTEIHFHIDVMQTWGLDTTLGQCFVERNHEEIDYVGSNLVPEPFGEFGVITAYESNLYGGTIPGERWCYVVLSQTDPNGDSAPSGILAGMYNGLTVVAFTNTGAPLYNVSVSMNDYITSFNGREESIIAIYKAPRTSASFTSVLPVYQRTFSKPALYATAFEGYTPKNKKLYTAPYCYPVLETNMGSQSKLRFEYFDNSNTMIIETIATAVPAPEFMAYPREYAGESFAYDAGLLLSDYAQGSWGGDSFKIWLAQNTGATAIRIAGTAAQIGYSFMADNPVTSEAKSDETGKHIAVRAGIEEATNMLSNMARADAQINPVFGNVSKGTLLTAKEIQDVNFKVKCLKYDIAERVDSYFDKYGYAINHIMRPNLNARPHWTYVKTAGCVLFGNAPADDMRLIEQIFDAGITFWNNGDEVGNYSLDNRVGTTQG